MDMSYATQSYNLDDFLYDGVKVVSNVGIVRNMDNNVVQLTCTIHNGHRSKIYMKVFEELVSRFVSSLQDDYKYQQGYLDGIEEGKKMALKEIKNTVEGA